MQGGNWDKTNYHFSSLGRKILSLFFGWSHGREKNKAVQCATEKENDIMKHQSLLLSVSNPIHIWAWKGEHYVLSLYLGLQPKGMQNKPIFHMKPNREGCILCNLCFYRNCAFCFDWNLFVIVTFVAIGTFFAIGTLGCFGIPLWALVTLLNHQSSFTSPFMSLFTSPWAHSLITHEFND